EDEEYGRAGIDEGSSGLEALGFAAREGGEGLAKGQIAKSKGREGAEGADNGRFAREEGEGFVDREAEDVVRRFSVKLDREHILVEASTSAGRAGQRDVGQKLHLDSLGALAGAGLAAAERDVEREMTGGKAKRERLALRGKEGADAVPRVGVRGRVA